jgi:hypothetical protein
MKRKFPKRKRMRRKKRKRRTNNPGASATGSLLVHEDICPYFRCQQTPNS